MEATYRQETQSYTVWPDMEEMLKDAQGGSSIVSSLGSSKADIRWVALLANSRRQGAAQATICAYIAYKNVGRYVGRHDKGLGWKGYSATGDHYRSR